MMLKTKSIATKLLLFSCVSAIVIIVGIVGFIKISMIPKLTDKALENHTAALTYSLKELHNTPEQWTEDALLKDKSVDFFSHGGKNVATLFLMKNGEYVRFATTLLKEDGTRAIGTQLDPNSAAAKALKAGNQYSGPITLFNRPHMATYTPVSFPNGTQGAVFIGIDYNSADPMLALAYQMDYMVIGVGIFGVVLLGIGFAFSVRVEQRHREIEDIMRTMQEGLFLLDDKLCMGAQTSTALSRILGFEVHPGDHFLELLKPSVSPKTYETAKEYIDLLMRHEVKEKLVASLNPLDCIEISAMQTNGKMESRFLQIRFNRVIRGKKVTHLLVTANDITRQVKLERELKESERRVQDQMSMMVHILQEDPRPLQEFLGGATNGLNEINEVLRLSNPKTGISSAELDTIMRRAHQLKGDASALQLEAVTQSLHALESFLQDLKQQSERKSEDLLPVTVRVKGLYGEISAIQDVMARIGQIRGGLVSVEPPKPPRDSAVAVKPFARQWHSFTQQLATKHEKQVDFTYQGLDLDELSPSLREAFNTMVNQFIRNSLVHGVENSSERKQRGKSEVAHINVYIADQGDGIVELSFRDDGRGINTENIREAALRSGRCTPEEAKALSPRQLTLMIFEPGLSTQKEVSEDAGRGVGLDAVKDLIARLGGRIRLGSTMGEYCHFRVQLPLKTDIKDLSLNHPNPLETGSTEEIA